ncbi:hypothetical protein CEXT_430171 [Caerostris extrusa]|uniref:Uncharacterized protein n=1 Tax=Caerostris extrusa TaxID=172846 RepID=A0AAV4Y099_CAEEX|nr:hypothetical protein CEXT_430171 [Caerostris extrusa]
MEDHGVDYVHEFDLEHLEEDGQAGDAQGPSTQRRSTRAARHGGGTAPQNPHLVEPQHHPNGGYGMNVGGPMPQETSSSHHATRYSPLVTCPLRRPFVATSGPIIDDGMLWLTQNLRYGGPTGPIKTGPLDLRPPSVRRRHGGLAHSGRRKKRLSGGARGSLHLSPSSGAAFPGPPPGSAAGAPSAPPPDGRQQQQ